MHTDLDSRVIVCLYVKGGTSVHQLEVTDAWRRRKIILNACLQLFGNPLHISAMHDCIFTRFRK